MPPADFPDIFRRLKAILEPYAQEMDVVADSETDYVLNTRHIMGNGQPLFFASVTTRKRYVAFHVMPVYAFPDLLEDIGDLRKRMQGKSCFNFRQLDDDQVAVLTDLVRRGRERYATEGMLT
jgi:hypothetical protein